MDNRQFIKDYKQAFGEKALLPIAFWHSDTPVAAPEPVNGCFFPAFEKVRDVQPVSFDNITMIGLFDPSVRPRVRANELMFGIPKSRLEEMATFMRDTCLFNGAAWPKVKERIKNGSTLY